MKPIRLSFHAANQAWLRGADENDIKSTIEQSVWHMAKNGRWRATKTFIYAKKSPINQKVYLFKTVEPIFVEEDQEIVVVTVKVYYSNKEAIQ